VKTSDLLTAGPFDAAADVSRGEKSDSKASQFVKRHFVKGNGTTLPRSLPASFIRKVTRGKVKTVLKRVALFWCLESEKSEADL
jgi:hypothetical protein